jgi:hypothetical protein
MPGVTPSQDGGSGGDHVLDAGPANQRGDDDLAVFVDRLAAAGTDRPTTEARTQICRTIATGRVPPWLRRLAEALAASVAELPPAQRRPSDDPGSVVAAVRDHPLMILDDFDAAAVASAVAALLADGRRVIVTGTDPDELAAVRTALPPEAADRALSRLPALSPAEQRELRRLLATSTPGRRARGGQELPPDSDLPDADEVAQLCAHAERSPETATGIRTLSTLLADLDEERRAAVTSVAEGVDRSLREMPPRGEHEWTWALLSELIYGMHRATVDQMLEDTAEVCAVLDRTSSAPPVSFTAAPPPGAVEVLLRYREFLAAGGRARSYFRSPVQREVQPVLDLVLIGSRRPESEDDVDRVIEYLELVERQSRIDAACEELRVPVPGDEVELAELSDRLVKVATAARAVGGLRHDVLFIAPDSPLSVPDVAAAGQVATAILEFADLGSAVDAGRRLDALADALADVVPAGAMAPEHEQAVTALRERDGAAYGAAVETFGAARREARDEKRRLALLERLAESAPRLAEAWTTLAESDPAALGLAAFVPADSLLSTLPPTDSADVVLVLGAGTLGVERLLLAAVAPRMIAVVGPDDARGAAPTLLSVLRRASALAIRGRGAADGGRVVPILASVPRKAAVVGRIGA